MASALPRSQTMAKKSPVCRSFAFEDFHRQENNMYRLPEVKWKRPAAWKQLVPRCTYPDCHHRSNWSSVLHRISGFRFNEKEWFCSPGCLEAGLEEHLLERFFE